MPKDVIGAAEWTLIILGLVLFAGLCWLWARRRWLSRAGGTFACSLRQPRSTPGTRWVLGVARYRGHQLQWFPAISLSLWPTRRFDRKAVRAGEQRLPNRTESLDLPDGQRIVGLHGPKGVVELAMARDSMTGLLSWLEAAPPGMHYRQSPASPR